MNEMVLVWFPRVLEVIGWVGVDLDRSSSGVLVVMTVAGVDFAAPGPHHQSAPGLASRR